MVEGSDREMSEGRGGRGGGRDENKNGRCTKVRRVEGRRQVGEKKGVKKGGRERVKKR